MSGQYSNTIFLIPAYPEELRFVAVCRYPCRKREISGVDSVVPMANSDVHGFSHLNSWRLGESVCERGKRVSRCPVKT